MIPLGRFLRWVYLARFTLAAGVFAAALLVWTRPEVTPETTLWITLILVTTLGFTAGSFWKTEIGRQRPSQNFLYVQALFDVALVAAVVHTTGRADSDLVPLYVLVITEASLLLPARGGLLVGVLATLLYVLDALLGGRLPTVLGAVPGGSELDPSVLIQVVLFGLIAVATVILGDRLRRAGSQLGQVVSELRQLRLDTSEILGSLDTGVVTLNADGAVVYMNAAAESLLGMRGREWEDRSAVEALDRAAPGLGSVVRGALSAGGAVQWHETHSVGAPEVRALGIRTTPLERDPNPWATLVVQDITDSKRVEALNRRAERLEAIRELAASLAHEIKNPLASIRSAVEQLTEAAKPLEERDRGVLGGLVLTESDRLSRLLSGFIEFSRVEIEERIRFDLGDVVRAAVDVVRQHPDAHGAVVELDVAAVAMEGDPDLVHRSAFNLVLNAVQHSPDGVPVRVRVEPVSGSAIPPGADFSAGARFEVSDRGAGIDSATAARMFDPFFTTRAGGSGLGLALVHRAVEAHEGLMFIDSEPGRGTSVTVYLPAEQAKVAP